MSSIVLRKDPRTNVFERDPLEVLAREGTIDLQIMEGTLEKVERIVISKPVEELRNWCSHMNLFGSFLILLMAFSVFNIIYNPHRLDRLMEVQKSWHYTGLPLQGGMMSKRSSKFNAASSYDDPLMSDLDQVISSNIEWFDSYFKDDEIQTVSSETKLANYKQKLTEILHWQGLQDLGNLEEDPKLRLQVQEADKVSATAVQDVLQRLEFSLIFVFISMTIAFAVAMRIYCGAMYFASLRLNQQKNIRKLLEIENDQFYIAKGLYWVCNSSMTQISILRAGKNLVPTGEKCHLYKLTHSSDQKEEKRPGFGINFFSKFPSTVSSVFTPKPPQHHQCQCQGYYHQPACHNAAMHRPGWYGHEQDYMQHGGMGPPGMMPPGQYLAPSVHQNFVNVYSTNIVTPNLPGLRNRRTVEQYLDPMGGEWYVQDDGDEVMSDPGTRSFLDTENTSDKETVKKRGSQAGSKYYPRRADSGTASIKIGAPWLAPRTKKKTQKAFRSNVSSKQ